ncbi:hypothetical protein I601_2402 [Nocardioides dokdonensis FR1436]|uniref:DUF4190 domain-containing protein n=1 Tax=Nocardioides dokdonensis FR1436 TaxID=1300347 RepID=A0A1A9GMB1_9ACTN|nr:DUF4190 domain-containing protein [Nocardioides dokdonensis]ANH38820.1 hypothetical protein I601_2402 [Nocardioides dokdonensis FR1436]
MSNPPPEDPYHPQPPPPPQNPYGQAFPGAGDPRQEGPPSKAMAVASLVLSFLFCVPFVAAIASIVLGVIVLGRSRNGRDHGRGLAIAGIVISTLVLLATIAVVVLIVVFASQVQSVDDLEEGQCVNFSGVDDSSSTETFSAITLAECTESHDAEVVGVYELTEDLLAQHPDRDYTEICTPAFLASSGSDRDDLDATFATDVADPDPGDQVACFFERTDGEKLTAPLG